jgi:predicted dienelactone hydrolase
VVVFSHGAFGVRNSNTTTFLELASRGFIVASIDHPYHCKISIAENRTTFTTVLAESPAKKNNKLVAGGNLKQKTGHF